MSHRASITEALALIFQGIAKLKECFPEKAFTIDGRLVGDIGEVLASLEYEVKLYEVQTPAHDGETPDGRKVQVKATFKDKLTMTAVPELYLGLALLVVVLNRAPANVIQIRPAALSAAGKIPGVRLQRRIGLLPIAPSQ